MIPSEAVGALQYGGGLRSQIAERVPVVLLTICRLREVGEHVSYDVLMRETGLARTTLKDLLDYMREQGLVTWEDGKSGTIRPLVEETARNL